MKLAIREEVRKKVMAWVNMADFEVSGLGLIKVIDKVPTVVDVFLLEQTAERAETEIDAAAIAKLEYQVKDMDGELRWWWHSHVKMSCFWSSEDMKTINQLGKEGWFYHTVFNQKNEHLSAFSCKQDIPHLIEEGQIVHFYDKVDTDFLADSSVALECKKEYDDKVKVKKSAFLERMGTGTSGTTTRDNENQTAAFDFKFMLYDLMEQGWTNSDINKVYQPELKEFKFKIKDLRTSYDLYFNPKYRNVPLDERSGLYD